MRSKRRSSESFGGGVRGLDVRGARELCRLEPGRETSRSGYASNATQREGVMMTHGPINASQRCCHDDGTSAVG